MGKSIKVGSIVLLVLIACAARGRAQTVNVEGSSAEASSAQSAGGTYELRSGMNEFGFWGGFAPAATTAFGGLHHDEAQDRKLTLAAFRYGRVFAACKRIVWEYTIDAMPIALAISNNVSAVRATP